MFSAIFNIGIIYVVTKTVYIDLLLSIEEYEKCHLPVIILQVISLLALFSTVVAFLYENILIMFPKG